jgi:hypothetical protein
MKYSPMGAHIRSKRLGGASVDDAFGVDVDAAGNILVCGSYLGSTDLGGGLLRALAPRYVLAGSMPTAITCEQTFLKYGLTRRRSRWTAWERDCDGSHEGSVLWRQHVHGQRPNVFLASSTPTAHVWAELRRQRL